jgi:hypothetical protein
MNADEIRRFDAWSSSSQNIQSQESFWLKEIAALLSELNENLAKIVVNIDSRCE